MRKTMTIAAAMLAVMMMLASVASAQVPGDGGGDPVVDPYFVPPTEEPTEGGGVSPTEVATTPERGEPAPVSRGVPRPAAQPQLAETGMTLSVGLVAGFGLLALGGGLLLVSRRRKSALQ